MDRKSYLALEAKAEKECTEAWEALSLMRVDAMTEDGNEDNAFGYLVNALSCQSSCITDKAEEWLVANGVRF